MELGGGDLPPSRLWVGATLHRGCAHAYVQPQRHRRGLRHPPHIRARGQPPLATGGRRLMSTNADREVAGAGGSRIDAYVWRISAVVIVGAMMSILDTTIVNVALATLRRDLHSSIA